MVKCGKKNGSGIKWAHSGSGQVGSSSGRHATGAQVWLALAGMVCAARLGCACNKRSGQVRRWSALVRHAEGKVGQVGIGLPCGAQIGPGIGRASGLVRSAVGGHATSGQVMSALVGMWCAGQVWPGIGWSCNGGSGRAGHWLAMHQAGWGRVGSALVGLGWVCIGWACSVQVRSNWCWSMQRANQAFSFLACGGWIRLGIGQTCNGQSGQVRRWLGMWREGQVRSALVRHAEGGVSIGHL